MPSLETCTMYASLILSWTSRFPKTLPIQENLTVIFALSSAYAPTLTRSQLLPLHSHFSLQDPKFLLIYGYDIPNSKTPSSLRHSSFCTVSSPQVVDTIPGADSRMIPILVWGSLGRCQVLVLSFQRSLELLI